MRLIVASAVKVERVHCFFCVPFFSGSSIHLKGDGDKNMNKKLLTIGCVAIAALVLVLVNPLGLDLNQKIVMSVLLCGLACFATDVIHKSITCVVLVGTFVLFGNTQALDIVQFVWSETNLLIMSTTLLSVALMSSHRVQQYIQLLLQRFSKNKYSLLLLPYLLGLVLIVFIPQAFARAIIVGTMLDKLLLAQTPQEKRVKSIILFNAFAGISIPYMLFSNGDIVLNVSAITFAGEKIAPTLQFANWFLLMSVPVVLTAVLTISATAILFKKDLAHFHVGMLQQDTSTQQAQTVDVGLWTMLAVLIGWMTYAWHGIPASVFALIGVAILFVAKTLKVSDLKAINVHFILFLMTVFSIGRVLGKSGITAKLLEQLKGMIPQEQSWFYVLIIITMVMLVHMFIGSAVATLSVVLPILIPVMTTAGYTGTIVVLMAYVIVNIHFVLPFHHAVMMIGIGRKYYSEQTLLKYGAVMTFLTPLLILGVYFGWWYVLGAL